MSGVDGQVGEVVARALEGDRDAIETLYALYNHRLIGIAHGRLGHTLHGLMESVDLVQSVWADVLPVLSQFEDRGEDSFFRWLHTCLLHKISQKRRFHVAKKRATKRLMSLSDGPEPRAEHQRSPSQNAAMADDLVLVLEMLERFPRGQRDVMLAHMRDGLTFPQIAEQIGKSEEATKKIYQRALARLIEMLPREWSQPNG